MNSPMQPTLSVSVAVATYNGQRYLAEQLQSMAAQTRVPDEIVFGDDGSADGTEAIVQAFAAAHPHITVRWHRNVCNLGSSANFEAIVRRCTGDVVVFSDQDDIWLPQRIERLLAAMDGKQKCLGAFSNGLLMDGDGAAIPGTLFDSIEFSAEERQRFVQGDALGVLLRRNVVTGAALAVRRNALHAAMPFCTGWTHDYLIAVVAACTSELVLVDEPLIRYRLHAGQQVGVSRGSGAAVLRYARKQSARWVDDEARQWQDLGVHLNGLMEGSGSGSRRRAVLPAVAAKVAFLERRARMRKQPLAAPFSVAGALLQGRYAQFSLGWKQAVVDLVSAALAVRGTTGR
jgi:Glycosyl transferase family 2